MNPKLQLFKKISSKILVPLGILFIVYIAERHWGEVKLAFNEFDRPLFALSIAFGIFGNLGIALLFRSLLVKHNCPIKAQEAISLFYASQVTKYVPGKIWGILYQASRVKGVTGSIAILLSNVELMATGIITYLAIATAILSFGSSPPTSCLAIIAGIGITYYVSRGNPLLFVRNYLDKKLNSEQLGSTFRSETFEFDFAAFWACSFAFVIANMTMLSAFFDLDTMSTFDFIGYLMLAWVVSVFAIVMPAGIGVREVVFLLIAGGGNDYPAGLLVTIAIVSRFWQLTVDIFGGAFILFLRRYIWKY